MRIAICDDDGVSVQQVEELLHKEMSYLEEHTIISFFSAKALLHACQQDNSFDLIFLEAGMKGLSGMEAARQIRSLNQQVMLVFISECPEYMPEAFDVAAKKFLIKPLQTGEFRKIYYSCLQQYRAADRRFVLHARTEQRDNILFAARIADLILIEVERGKTVVYLNKQEKIYVREKIGSLEQRLKHLGFVRPNSGALVNLAYLERIDLDLLHILLQINGQNHPIPIARRKKKEILQQYQNYWLKPGALMS